MNKELKFTVFCIENYKNHCNLSGSEVVKVFTDYDVFGYINEFFDVLHSTSHNYINNDIDIYLKSRGYEIPA
ncbi:MAG: DUF3791 domain-containing protein [Clostridia bacterium]|nr:DUF3791 domain-containing protein [Clostridia bacterium]